jgi:hypothetical protein
MLLVALGASMAWAAIDPPPPRPMSVEVERDTINDRVTATATLRDGSQRLTLSCNPDDYDFVRVAFSSNRWLVFGNFITGERPLVYRFDDMPPRRLIWEVKDRSGRLAGRRRVTEFLRGLIDGQVLIFRTRDVEGHAFDLTFRLVGARAAVAQLLEICGETRVRDRLLGPA